MDEINKEDKKEIYNDFKVVMPGQDIPSFSQIEKIVLACRILGANGHGENLAGQITYRSETREDCYLTLSLGTCFNQITQKDICLIDSDMNVIESDHNINPALRFHMWLYRARPEIKSIVHTHPPHSSALSMIGQPLCVSHMDSAMLHDDCAYLAEWPGVPFSDDEGRIISEAIGDKRSILLAHHGILTTGQSIEEAVYLAVFMERTAQMQLRAQAAGAIKKINPDHARDAHDFLLTPGVVNATFNAWGKEFIKQA